MGRRLHEVSPRRELTNAGTMAAVEFWTWQLFVAMAMNGVVQAFTIAAYAARLAGALSGRAATAMSLFNIFVTSSRFAQMVYTPILGSLSDRSALATLGSFQWQLRVIILGGMAGAIAGTFLIPTFVKLYIHAIGGLERHGSVPKAASRIFRARTAVALARTLSFDMGMLRAHVPVKVPKDVLLLNMFVTSIYGVGVVASAYASVLAPEAARTALLSSGLVNGFATIAYNIVVDPASAIATDRAARGERPIDEVRALVAGLSWSAILGFLLSQALLIPAALLIAWAARLIAGR